MHMSASGTMNEPLLTVFTPSYNRAHLLTNCYRSLKRQDRKNFIWLVIDDGSTDNTRETVEQMMTAERDFEIRYVYKPNGGLHTGYNLAISLMTTELSVCIDSDDMLADGAAGYIEEVWAPQRGREDIAGIVGLDVTAEGKRIGCGLCGGETVNAASLLCVKGCGDKKYVVRNDLLRSVAPMPVFEGEKNFNPHYLLLALSERYDFVAVNRPLCVVDYQPDGMSAGIFRQYVNSPNSFASLRLMVMSRGELLTPAYRYRNAAHYVSSSIIARRRDFIAGSPQKMLTIAAIPLGVAITAAVMAKTFGYRKELRKRRRG